MKRRLGIALIVLPVAALFGTLIWEEGWLAVGIIVTAMILATSILLGFLLIDQDQ